MVTRLTFRKILVFAVVLSLAVAACGSETSDGTSTTAQGEESATTQADESPTTTTGATTTTAAEMDEEREAVTLRLANGLSAGNQATVNWVEPFIEKAEELGQGSLTIEHFPDGQLGGFEDAVTVLQTGVTEISLVAPPYATGQMPLSNVLNLPGLGDFETLTWAYYDLMTDEDSLIYQTDFARNDVVPLAAGSTPAYQLVTVDTPITGPNALDGLLVRSSGGALDLVVRALGGEPVAVTSGEQYQALERGTVDAGIFNYPALLSASLHEVTNHGTLNANVGAFNFALGISADAWNELPTWAQEVLIEAGRYATESRIETLKEEDEAILQELRDSGFTFYEFDDAQLAELSQMLESVSADWVETVTAEDYPAAEALAEARAAVDARG